MHLFDLLVNPARPSQNSHVYNHYLTSSFVEQQSSEVLGNFPLMSKSKPRLGRLAARPSSNKLFFRPYLHALRPTLFRLPLKPFVVPILRLRDTYLNPRSCSDPLPLTPRTRSLMTSQRAFQTYDSLLATVVRAVAILPSI
jgi:hypothetical protein